MFKAVSDTGQNVRSVGYLTVYKLFFCDEGAGIQVDQLHQDRGRAIVHRKPVMVMALVTRFHMGHDSVVFSVNKGHRNIEIRVPAHGVENPQDVQGNGHMFIAKSTQCQQDPAVITDRGFFCWHFQA